MRARLALCCLLATVARAAIFDVRATCGATGDGATNDTLAVQRCLSAAAAAGGDATVLFPTGVFLSWPLTWLGAVDSSLVFAPGASLLAPPMSAWPAPPPAYLRIAGGRNLTLRGAGQFALAIDGRGGDWWAAFAANTSLVRPNPLLALEGIAGVVLQELQLADAPMFHVVLSGVAGALVEDISVSAATTSPNTDGIDPSHSSDVTMRRLHVVNGDDGVAVKAGCKGIVVEDSFFNGSHGLSIGSLGENGATDTVEDVLFQRCTLVNTQGAAKIKAWQGGHGYARNISWRNITVSGAQTPLLLTQFYCPHSTCKPQPGGVLISNITVAGLAGTQVNGDAASIACTADAPCTGLALSDIHITPAAGTATNRFTCAHAFGTAVDVSPSACLQP